jgi:hypothetical protein
VRNEKLELYLNLFELGKELSSMYEEYDGDLDWPEFVAHCRSKSLEFDGKLDAFITSARQEGYEQGKKEGNSGRIMYEQGYRDGVTNEITHQNGGE